MIVPEVIICTTLNTVDDLEVIESVGGGSAKGVT
jgi:hypothetical protein